MIKPRTLNLTNYEAKFLSGFDRGSSNEVFVVRFLSLYFYYGSNISIEMFSSSSSITSPGRSFFRLRNSNSPFSFT